MVRAGVGWRTPHFIDVLQATRTGSPAFLVQTAGGGKSAALGLGHFGKGKVQCCAIAREGRCGRWRFSMWEIVTLSNVPPQSRTGHFVLD